MSRATRKPKPPWLKTRLPGPGRYADVKRTLRELGLNTVCTEASCPNLGECWGRGAVTVMILGKNCSRDCRFCRVGHDPPRPPDPTEPEHVARALSQLKLKYAVLTSVTRDDLTDGGASHWAETVRAVREACPDLAVEALTPDFGGSAESLDTVLEAGPHILAHNLETVRRLSPLIRPQAGYVRSLALLRRASDAGFVTKSGLMLGMGETDDEVMEAARDLRSAGASILTLGQYLQPSRAQVPVDRYVEPEKFDRLGLTALAEGFVHVESGPLVRSSYRAEAQAARVKPGT